MRKETGTHLNHAANCTLHPGLLSFTRESEKRSNSPPDSCTGVITLPKEKRNVSKREPPPPQLFTKAPTKPGILAHHPRQNKGRNEIKT